MPVKEILASEYLEYAYTESLPSPPSIRIENEFPNTRNGHSTQLQHQYIADSIIEYMKN